MDRPRLYVDFNEMVEPNLVLLSQGDVEVDSSGTSIALYEGLRVYVYQNDIDDTGVEDALIADGLVEACSREGWAAAAKWCCRIDGRGIRNISDEEP